MPLQPHQLRLLLTALLLLPAAHALAEDPAPLPNAPTAAQTDLPEIPPPPAWMQWHGWSDDGQFLAWREGNSEQQMARGQPVEIARVDAKGAILAREHIVENPAAVLEARHIHLRAVAETEAVTPSDVLVRTTGQRLLAVLARDEPAPIAGVMEKRGDEYHLRARWQVRGPVEDIRVTAAEDEQHRRLALIVHTGRGKSQQGTLLVLPLMPGSSFNAPADLPAAATPAAPDAAKRASP